MQTAKSKIENICSTMFILLSALALVLLSGHSATAGYADSAHGDSSSGVKRSGIECPTGTPCPQGDCSNCYDSFEPNICGVSAKASKVVKNIRTLDSSRLLSWKDANLCQD